MSRTPLAAEVLTFMRALGDAFRAARREAGLEQGQAAARAGFGGNGWGQVERGRGDPSLGRVAMMARVLRLPLSAIMRRAEIALLDDRGVESMRARLRESAGKLAPADLDLMLAIVARLLRRE